MFAVRELNSKGLLFCKHFAVDFVFAKFATLLLISIFDFKYDFECSFATSECSLQCSAIRFEVRFDYLQ